MKKFFAFLLAAAMLAGCACYADSAIDTIMTVGTTQAFSDEAVSSEDLETIVAAGLASVSAINQQPWFMVAITDSEIMQQLAGSGSGFSGAPAGASGAPAGFEGAPAGASGAPAGFEGGAAPEGAPAGAMPAAAGGTSAKASLGDSPAAIIIYKATDSKSPNPDFDCGLAAQNMYIAAASLGYSVKIVTSPTMSLNGANHDSVCEMLGVDSSMQAVAVLLIGYPDQDAVGSASVRSSVEEKAVFIG